MSSALTRLSRVSSAIAISFALAAAPAAAAGYIKLGDIKGQTNTADSGHRGEIQIESFSWGQTQVARGGGSAGKATFKEFTVTKKTDTSSSAHGAGGGGGAGKVNVHDISMSSATGDGSKKESGEKGGTADINIGVGELQETSVSKSMDRTSVPLAQHALIGRTPRGTARRASLTVQVPAGTCRPGARYPTAELGADGRVYTMTGVVVANCAPARARDGIPTETLSMNFDKITWK